jgi:hypothetical protein
MARRAQHLATGPRVLGLCLTFRPSAALVWQLRKTAEKRAVSAEFAAGLTTMVSSR